MSAPKGTGLTGIESPLPGAPNRPDTYGEVSHDIMRVLLKPTMLYFVSLAACVTMMVFGGWYWFQQITWGMGVANITHPTMWGVYIVTFVFWVGIGHAGTLISAVLFLVRSRWRTGKSSAVMTANTVIASEAR